jgi:hypothetical protein
LTARLIKRSGKSLISAHGIAPDLLRPPSPGFPASLRPVSVCPEGAIPKASRRPARPVCVRRAGRRLGLPGGFPLTFADQLQHAPMRQRGHPLGLAGIASHWGGQPVVPSELGGGEPERQIPVTPWHQFLSPKCTAAATARSRRRRRARAYSGQACDTTARGAQEPALGFGRCSASLGGRRPRLEVSS